MRENQEDMNDLDNEFTERPELVKLRARTIRVQWAWNAFWIVVVVIVLGILTFDVLNGQAARKELLDCTTPGGECYREGNQRTADAIAQLIEANTLSEVATRRVVVIAAACAATLENPTTARVEQCVNAQLDADKEEE